MKMVKVKFTANVLCALAKETGWAFKVMNGVPKDAVFKKISNNKDGTYDMFFEHDSFDDVKAHKVPEIKVDYQTYAVQENEESRIIH